MSTVANARWSRTTKKERLGVSRKLNRAKLKLLGAAGVSKQSTLAVLERWYRFDVWLKRQHKCDSESLRSLALRVRDDDCFPKAGEFEDFERHLRGRHRAPDWTLVTLKRAWRLWRHDRKVVFAAAA